MALRSSRLLPQFRWNDNLKRYIAPNGQFVSRETVKAAAESVVQQTIRDQDALSLRFYNGEITHSQWDGQMRQLIRRQQMVTTSLACGGWENMTPRDYGRAGVLTREQYKYLNGMGERIQSGYYGDDLQSGNFLGHARLYALDGRTTFEYVQGMNAIEDLGHNQISNELGGSEKTCEGEGSCRAMSTLGWVDVEGEVFRDLWKWPGDRLCLAQCHCRAKTRRQPSQAE